MRVLIIGSLAGELGQAARIAIARGAKLDQADDADTALARLRSDAHVDLVLCDLIHDVGAVVRALAAERIAVPVVACGTGDNADAAARAIREGAREFLPLPPDPDLIAAILEAAAGESHAMVVRDPAMQATVRRAEQVAASEASVLITGESGTGKEVLARHIHRRSRRSGGSVRCAELRGDPGQSAGVGAVRPREGRVLRRGRTPHRQVRGRRWRHAAARRNQRDGRPAAGQAVARACRRGDRPAGWCGAGASERAHPRDHQSRPAGRGAARHFREDLYFRLNVVSLRIPPLRERPGDIAALADHFARRYAEVNGLPFRPLSRDAAAATHIACLARQRARTGERDPPRGAACRWRGDRHRSDRAGRPPAATGRAPASQGASPRWSAAGWRRWSAT